MSRLVEEEVAYNSFLSVQILCVYSYVGCQEPCPLRAQKLIFHKATGNLFVGNFYKTI